MDAGGLIQGQKGRVLCHGNGSWAFRTPQRFISLLTPFPPVTRHLNVIKEVSRRRRGALAVHIPKKATQGSRRHILVSPHPLSYPASRVHISHGWQRKSGRIRSIQHSLESSFVGDVQWLRSMWDDFSQPSVRFPRCVLSMCIGHLHGQLCLTSSSRLASIGQDPL